MDLEVANKIEKVEKLTEIFGRFPSFHDAEVLKIVLDRKGNGFFKPTLETSVHVWQMTKEIDEDRRYILKNHCIVDFQFSEVEALRLENFNHQNVLGDIEIDDISKNQFKPLKRFEKSLSYITEDMAMSRNFHVKFYYCHGVEAEFLCNSIRVLSVKRLSAEEVKEISLSGKIKEDV